MSMTVARILLIYRKMHVYFAFGCYAQRAMNTTWTPLLLKMRGFPVSQQIGQTKRFICRLMLARNVFNNRNHMRSYTNFQWQIHLWWRCYESQFMVDDNVSFGHDEIYLIYTNSDHKLSTPKLSSNFYLLKVFKLYEKNDYYAGKCEHD